MGTLWTTIVGTLRGHIRGSTGQLTGQPTGQLAGQPTWQLTGQLAGQLTGLLRDTSHATVQVENCWSSGHMQDHQDRCAYIVAPMWTHTQTRRVKLRLCLDGVVVVPGEPIRAHWSMEGRPFCHVRAILVERTGNTLGVKGRRFFLLFLTLGA